MTWLSVLNGESRRSNSARRLGAPRLVRGRCTGGTSLDSATLPVSKTAGYRTVGLVRRARGRVWHPSANAPLAAMDPRGDRPRGDRRRRAAPGPGVQDPEPAEGEQDLRRRSCTPSSTAPRRRSPRCTRRPTSCCPARARACRRACARCAGIRSWSTSGPRGAARAAWSCPSSSARRWTTASAWPSSASTCATTAAPRRSCCATSRSPTRPTRTPTARSPTAIASWARRARSTTTPPASRPTSTRASTSIAAQLDADIKRYAAS